MKPFTLLLLLMSSPAVAGCPPVADITSKMDALIERARTAPNQRAGLRVSGEMWELWLAAPDMQAQEWLDEGMTRMRIGDMDGAQIAFDALVDYCPAYPEGWNQRAFLAFSLGDFPSALADLDTALDLDPRHTGVLTGKGMTLIALGRIAEGQDAIRDALDLNPWLNEARFLELQPESTDL